MGYEDELDTLIPFLTYVKVFQKDAFNQVDIIGVHWYRDLLTSKRLNLGIAHLMYPDKPIMMTESCPGNAKFKINSHLKYLDWFILMELSV